MEILCRASTFSDPIRVSGCSEIMTGEDLHNRFCEECNKCRFGFRLLLEDGSKTPHVLRRKITLAAQGLKNLQTVLYEAAIECEIRKFRKHGYDDFKMSLYPSIKISSIITDSKDSIVIFNGKEVDTNQAFRDILSDDDLKQSNQVLEVWPKLNIFAEKRNDSYAISMKMNGNQTIRDLWHELSSHLDVNPSDYSLDLSGCKLQEMEKSLTEAGVDNNNQFIIVKKIIETVVVSNLIQGEKKKFKGSLTVRNIKERLRMKRMVLTEHVKLFYKTTELSDEDEEISAQIEDTTEIKCCFGFRLFINNRRLKKSSEDFYIWQYETVEDVVDRLKMHELCKEVLQATIENLFHEDRKRSAISYFRENETFIVPENDQLKHIERKVNGHSLKENIYVLSHATNADISRQLYADSVIFLQKGIICKNVFQEKVKMSNTNLYKYSCGDERHFGARRKVYKFFFNSITLASNPNHVLETIENPSCFCLRNDRLQPTEFSEALLEQFEMFLLGWRTDDEFFFRSAKEFISVRSRSKLLPPAAATPFIIFANQQTTQKSNPIHVWVKDSKLNDLWMRTGISKRQCVAILDMRIQCPNGSLR